jgi:5-methylcytosine-specific restriction endonuclease McrA
VSGGWEGSDRKSRLPSNWVVLVAAVMRRCGRRCEKLLPSGERCPRPATDVDHKIPGDDHRMTNLQGLCAHHHAQKSSSEGNAARRGAPKSRPPESHPGWRG